MRPAKGDTHEKLLGAGHCWPQGTTKAGLRNPGPRKLDLENPCTMQEPEQSGKEKPFLLQLW